VQFCNPPDLLAFVAVAHRVFFGSLIVFDQHDLGPELVEAKNFKRPRLLKKIAVVLERFAYRNSNAVIATNQSYKEIAVNRGKVPMEQVTIVRSGPRSTWGTLLLPDSKTFRIGYVGVIGVQEGLDIALEAMKILKSKVSQRFQSEVTFHGRVSDSNLIEILGATSVCINPDRFNLLNNLSTMNKVVEYMALGKAIVQFDLAEGKRSAEQSSLYAKVDSPDDLAEKIHTLILNPALAKSLGELGRRRFEDSLSWDISESKYIQVFDSLIGQTS
jgi:glycosyltransferase involved in cell wall biosynthesis